ncbi:hypothetical protein SDC9_174436 [bioreactor metagenome]|uniref:Uncharacterized protein n=1 Tax=bioreactor metagenome TaxID=1076179 RepID=A0A645GMA9_9ZZZZ
MPAQIPVLRHSQFLPSGIEQCVECAVNNSLRANIHPASGSHLSVVGNTHLRSNLPIGQVVELPNHHGVGNDNTWRIGFRFKQSERMSAFHHQRLVLCQLFQIHLNQAILHPVLTHLSGFAIRYQFVRIQGDVETQIIIYHHLESFSFHTFSFVLVYRFCFQVSIRTITIAINSSSGLEFF